MLLPSLTVLDEPLEVVDLLHDLVHRYQIRGKTIHDANVVAVMLVHGIHWLATYNSSDFERFEEIALEPTSVEDARSAS